MTAALAFAGVLAGTTIIAALATPLPFAFIHPFAIMLGNGGTTTLALARVLAGTSVVSTLTTSLALTIVMPLAHVFGSLVVGGQSIALASRQLRSCNHPSHSCAHDLSELPAIHISLLSLGC